MKRTDVVVIGGGQAGLATSHCLAARGIEHVVLERARIGERWRSERWDSLRLITPNWMTRLPGWRYTGPDPDGFMPGAEVADFLAAYAASFAAPIEPDTAVTRIEPLGGSYRVTTSRGVWQCRAVVVATGCFDRPLVPPMAAALSPRIRQFVPSRYRNPDDLPPGGALVVGASATGIQLAREIHRSGRPVTLAVGRHTRLPRRYRGADIMWWLDRIGLLSQPIESVPDPEAARRQPSLQLAGGRSIDLAGLRGEGVRLVGRAMGIDGSRVHLADDLPATLAAADSKLRRLLAQCDAWAATHGLADRLEPPEAPDAVSAGSGTKLLDLDAGGIASVVWATGFSRHYPWLGAGMLDAEGEIVHRGGVTPSAGLYAMGLRFMLRRNSTFIDGVAADAEEIVSHIARYLGRNTRVAA